MNDLENFLRQINEIANKMENLIKNAKDFQQKFKPEEDEIIELQRHIKDAILGFEINYSLLSDELKVHTSGCPCISDINNKMTKTKNNLTKLQNLLKDVQGLTHPLNTLFNTVKSFVSNYLNLLHDAYILKEAGKDKYYHAKANCEATQQGGILGKKLAEGLSNMKEYHDQFTYVHTHRVSAEEALRDSERDQKANELGREIGRNYPNCKCSELVKDQLPKR